MSLKKFRPNDVIINTMKAHPSCEFFVYDSQIYYNSRPVQSGAFADSVLCTSGGTGYISLYEYNIDRSSGQGYSDAEFLLLSNPDSDQPRSDPEYLRSNHGNHFIYPYIVKDGSKVSFKTIRYPGGGSDQTAEMFHQHADGDIITGSYPMSASIVRELWSAVGSDGFGAGDRKNCYRTGSTGNILTEWKCGPEYPHYWALKNRLNYYGARSPHYRVSSSALATRVAPAAVHHADQDYDWIKDQQTINFISVPSIFYGSQIKPGSLSLKWYYTGSLIGELQDTKHNGELIQITASDRPGTPGAREGTGSVAGVVLYEEGIILLTGSWALNGSTSRLTAGSVTNNSPSWIYFGAGANDGVSQANTSVNAPAEPSPGADTSFKKSSFNLSFKGTTKTQVVTMFAHARRGEANYSNNPTFLEYTPNEGKRNQIRITSSQVYEERTDRRIKNTVSSSYSDYSASFKRQVYISRVAVYDDAKNLIGIATLSNPVLKKEDEDFSFKIRLDI